MKSTTTRMTTKMFVDDASANKGQENRQRQDLLHQYTPGFIECLLCPTYNDSFENGEGDEMDATDSKNCRRGQGVGKKSPEVF